MFKIEQITNDSYQKQVLILNDGTQVTLYLYFRPLQFGWFINELTYGDFTLKGLRITNSPNFLYQFKNQIPFGMACFSKDNREPSQQDDFVSGNSVLYLLDETEVQELSELIINGEV